jgi:hypothetical protein
MLLTLPRTHLIGCQTIDLRPQIEIPANLKGQIKSEKSNLVSKMFGQWGGIPASLFSSGSGDKSVYGYVGIEDYTLFPLIRPGSFVQIDVNQTKVDRAGWRNEYDRPIYFVELRESYARSLVRAARRQPVADSLP